MSKMFGYSPFNQDISSWDVSNVTNMSFMFYSSMFNQDIKSWSVSKCESFGFMFGSSKFNKDLTGWDISGINRDGTQMSYMFGSDFSSENLTKLLQWFSENAYYSYFFQCSSYYKDDTVVELLKSRGWVVKTRGEEE